MTKLCLIGNSHLAAMMFAWDKMGADYPGIDPHYYSQHVNTLVDASLDASGRLCSGSEPFKFKKQTGPRSETESIDFSGFDAVVLVGLAFGPIVVTRPYRRLTYMGLKKKEGQVVSREQFRRAIHAHAQETAGLHIANLIKEKTKLYFVPCALPGERGLDDLEKPPMEIWRRATESGDAETLMQLYGSLCDELKASGISIVDQPDGTKAGLLWTQNRFNTNVMETRQGNVRPEDDYFHMNGEYGAVMWRELLDAMRRDGKLLD